MKRLDAIPLMVSLLMVAMMGQSLAQDVMQNVMKGPAIQAFGTGKVMARPDMARITLGVTTEDADVQEAVTQNNAAAERIISQLAKSGIDTRDIQTSAFSVYPQYKQVKDGEPAPQIFRVSNTVEVTVRNLDTLGTVLGQVVSAGSNQINGLSFSFSEPEPLEKQARERAIADARTRAETYAAAAGVKLGKILLIVDQPEGGAPILRAQVFRAREAANVPIEAGESTVQAQVAVLWEIVE